MRRRWLLWLAIGLGVGLGAGGVLGATPSAAVRVWLPGLATHREAILRDFRALHPEIRLEIVTLEPAEMRARLLSALAAGEAPDLFLAEFDWVGWLAEAGACAALDDYLKDLRDLAGIHPLVLRMLVVGGKVLGLPATGHPLALYLRSDWLGRLGLKPPSTWEELAQVAEAFTKKDPDGNGRADTYGLAERWPAGDPAVAERLLPWLYQAGGTLAASQDGRWTPAFGLSPGAKALRFRRRLWEAGLIPPAAPGNDAARNMALFLNGQAGMVVEDDSWIPAVRAALGSRAVTVPLPRDARMATTGDGFCFVLSARSNVKRAAFAFVSWWLSRETQEKLILGWDRKPGGEGVDAGPLIIGPRRDLDPSVLLGEPLYAGFVRSFPYLVPRPYCPNYAALRLVLARAAAAAMGPEKTVEEALAEAMKEVEGLLN